MAGFIKISLDFCGRIIYNIITARETERVGGQAQKEDDMEDMGMTDKQFAAFLRFVIGDLKKLQEQIEAAETEQAKKELEELIEKLQTSLEG